MSAYKIAVDAGNGVNLLCVEHLFEAPTLTHVLHLSCNSQYYTTIWKTFHESLPPLCVLLGLDARSQFIRVLKKVRVRRGLRLSV